MLLGGSSAKRVLQQYSAMVITVIQLIPFLTILLNKDIIVWAGMTHN